MVDAGCDHRLFVGVDVGTGSARAAIFNTAGCKLGYSSHPISMANPAPGHYEQSSREVWEAVGEAVRGALAAGAVDPAHVRGIGFDATCSLVVEGNEEQVGVASDPRTAQRAGVSAGVGGDGEHGNDNGTDTDTEHENDDDYAGDDDHHQHHYICWDAP